MNNQKTDTTLLHHYTSIRGFEGIIKDSSIRMTKSSFLNDPADCNLFLSLIEDYTARYSKAISGIVQNKKASLDQNHSNQLATIYKNNDYLKYIKWLHSNISLYIASFTCESDGDTMNMWNYYGKNGMKLSFSKQELFDALQKYLVEKASPDEFIAGTPVKYIKNDAKLEDISSIPIVSDLVVMNQSSSHMFKDHQNYIDKKSHYQIVDLYSTNTLLDFINSYIGDYIETLKYLLINNKINTGMESEQIFPEIFDNIQSLDKHLLWKHDLPHYIVILSALLKPDTYAHENEYRLVYYKYMKDSSVKEQYDKKSTPYGEFLFPYVNLLSSNTTQTMFRQSLQAITLSPLTHNLPIGENEYKETLKKYLAAKGFTDITIEVSNHKIRW